MILHHIQRDNAKGISINDSLSAMTAYLISAQFIMENSISGYLDIYDSLYYKLDDAGFVYVQLLNLPENSPERATLQDTYDLLSGQTRFRQNPENLEAFSAIKNNTIKWRAEDKKKHEDVIAENRFREIQKLIDRRKIFTEPILLYKETSADEDPYIEYLKNTLCETQHIPVLRLSKGEFTDSMSDKSFTDLINPEKLPGYISILLYTFPDISNLEYKSLESARDNILNDLKYFNRQVVDFHKICSQLNYDALSFQALRQLINEKLNNYSELQQIIDKENFSTQTINSEKVRYAEISLCITSLEMIAGYYEHSGMLEPYVADVLKGRLERTDNLKRCGIFFNIDVIQNVHTY